MPGNRPRLGLLAHALIAGLASHPAAETPYTSKELGYQLEYQLRHSYRMASGNKPSGAAHYKRQAKKRANIRARSKK